MYMVPLFANKEKPEQSAHWRFSSYLGLWSHSEETILESCWGPFRLIDDSNWYTFDCVAL